MGSHIESGSLLRCRMSNADAVERRSKEKTEIFNNLSKEDVEKYQEAFSVWDKNSSGRISMAELSDMLENLGKKPTETDLEDILEDLDTDATAGIDFAEFLILMTKTSGNLERQDELRKAFNVMDTDGDGKISGDDLQTILKKLGINIGDGEIEEMIKVADKKGEGLVSID